MQRRTFLQGLLAIPFISVAAKAFSKEDLQLNIKQDVGFANPKAVAEGAKGKVTHVIYFDKDKILEKGWVGIEPLMVLRGKKAVPLLVMEHASAVVDMVNHRVLKNRGSDLRQLTDAEHKSLAFTAYGRASFHSGNNGPVELTDEIRVKNKLAFANLREASTGEML